jgi:hypothetical protein
VRNAGVGPLADPTAMFMVGSTQSDAALLERAASWLKLSLQLHLFPVLAPVTLVVTIARRWNRLAETQLRTKVLLLAGLCVTARARRLFAHVEWYHFLLELPLYVAAAPLLLASADTEKLRKGLKLALVASLCVAAYSYRYFGVGPLTRVTNWDRLATPRGTIRVRPENAANYQALRHTIDSLDPSGLQPVFAFGYGRVFNYFLGRENPTPLTQGFRLTTASPDAVVSQLLARRDPWILIDNVTNYQFGVPSPGLHFTRCQQVLVENHYLRYDRPYFERLRDACSAVPIRRYRHPILGVHLLPDRGF